MHDPTDDHDPLPAGSASERTAALHAAVQALTGAACRRCGKRLCGHEAVLAILLGSRHRPRCAPCAADEQREPVAALCARSLQWIRRRECFLDAWHAAGDREGFGAIDHPACLVAAAPREADATPPVPTTPTAAPPTADALHDAGDLGCGDLVLELKFRLAELPPGAVLEVRATDPAAPIDLPAWCGLVGHTLLHAAHPRYWIRRKER